MRHAGSSSPQVLTAAVLFASLVATGCTSTAASNERAEPTSDFARPGAYVGLYGIESFENFHTSGSGVSSGNSDVGAGLKIGYRATPDVAVELLAENVKGFSLTDSNAKADMTLVNFGLMGKYYLATERFEPYLLAGFGLASAHVRHFDYDSQGGFLRGGVGMDVYIIRNVAVFGEANYNRLMGGVSDLHHIDVQLGLLFRF